MILIIGKILGIAAYAAVEYWLGKTDKTKAGSVIGLVEEIAKKIVKKEEPK